MSTLNACSHEQYIFGSETRKTIVDRVVEILESRVNDFDSIAVSGYSSALVGSIVAEKLNKSILLVRKESEERTSSYRVEGYSNQRAIFIDDLVDSGSTVQRVKKGCKSLDCRLVGVVLYNDSDLYDTASNIPIWGRFNINEILEDYPRSEGSDFSDYEEEDEGWSTEEDRLDEDGYSGWTT